MAVIFFHPITVLSVLVISLTSTAGSSVGTKEFPVSPGCIGRSNSNQVVRYCDICLGCWVGYKEKTHENICFYELMWKLSSHMNH